MIRQLNIVNNIHNKIFTFLTYRFVYSFFQLLRAIPKNKPIQIINL